MHHTTESLLSEPLSRELTKYIHKPVFFDPLHGNNGDKLIEMGSRALLQTLGIQLVHQPEQAEVILLNGGAGMTDIWLHGFQTLQFYNREYPDIPLVICPSSFWFTETDFSALFRDRRAPASIYAREPYSLKILQEFTFPSAVHLGLDHDMAFHLQGTDYLRNLKAKTALKHILIVERIDPESVTGYYMPPSNHEESNALTRSKALGQAVPQFIRQPLSRHFITPLKHAVRSNSLGRQGLNTAFTQTCLQQISLDYPALADLPVFAADISNPEFCSFRQFSRLIAEAAIVVTTRLHVAILAAMLGKPTYIKSGSYHKIQGIFEYSLAQSDQVRLI